MTDHDPPPGAHLERYAAILDVFAGLRGDLPASADEQGHVAYGVTDIANALGISRGTISRYLRRLEAADLLVRRPDRRYVLSTRVYHWGQAAKPGGNIQATAKPVMEELGERFGEPVSLFVLEDGVAVCIDQVDGIHPVRLNASVGRQLPLHTGASPRLLLAFASAALQEHVLASAPFPALTPATIQDAATLRRALEEARKQGIVVSVGESNEGVVGIAAPIRDARGEVIAALSVAGLETRLEGQTRLDCVDAVRSAAANISSAMGYIPHEGDATDDGEGS